VNPHTARRRHTVGFLLRRRREASILRGQGVKPGAPVLLIVADGKAYFLEVKTKAGRVTQAQADCHEKLRRAGAEVGVCRHTATEAAQ
jgi:hypothetical protein